MKAACEKLPLDQVSNQIDKDPHPQLWSDGTIRCARHASPPFRRTLAEEALNHFDIKVAEHAFVKIHDYYGLQFLRRLQQFQVRSAFLPLPNRFTSPFV